VAAAYSEPSVNRSDMSRALKNRFCRGSCSTCVAHGPQMMLEACQESATVVCCVQMCHPPPCKAGTHVTPHM
jgi:hypothetical protein